MFSIPDKKTDKTAPHGKLAELTNLKFSYQPLFELNKEDRKESFKILKEAKGPKSAVEAIKNFCQLIRERRLSPPAILNDAILATALGKALEKTTKNRGDFTECFKMLTDVGFPLSGDLKEETLSKLGINSTISEVPQQIGNKGYGKSPVDYYAPLLEALKGDQKTVEERIGDFVAEFNRGDYLFDEAMKSPSLRKNLSDRVMKLLEGSSTKKEKSFTFRAARFVKGSNLLATIKGIDCFSGKGVFKKDDRRLFHRLQGCREHLIKNNETELLEQVIESCRKLGMTDKIEQKIFPGKKSDERHR